MDKRTRDRFNTQKGQFCKLKNIDGLCKLLRTEKRKLKLIVQNPKYRTFTIPKKNGGERVIETPDRTLKSVQGRLNQYLQAVYYFEKSNAAYGFILGVRNDDDRRNIVTNAKKHLGNPHMLNLDLQDFFHYVSREKVMKIFMSKPFRFSGELLDILVKLTTYNDRLPMGTPTSPVLSNFACRELDIALVNKANEKAWKFTRYADDLTFSSKEAITDSETKNIQDIIQINGFKVNPSKIKQFGADDIKIVTGLVVAEKVELAPNYIQQLKYDLLRLGEVMKVQNEQGFLNSKWSDQFKQQVSGRLNFAGFVLGRKSAIYSDLRQIYDEALNPPEEEFGAVNWRSFPYNI